MKIKKSQLQRIIKEELKQINEAAPTLTGRRARLYPILIQKYPHLELVPVQTYIKAFDRVGETGMTNVHAVAAEMDQLHDDLPPDPRYASRPSDATDRVFFESRLKIKKSQLRRIIKEEQQKLAERYSHDQIEDYLRTQADEYHRTGDLAGNPGAIAMLLRDDFMDNIGAYAELTPQYEKLIQQLSTEADPVGLDMNPVRDRAEWDY